jgi:hypothetical protein
MSSELIGNPFSFFPPIIEIEHRGDGIHSQAINMVAIQPIESAVEKEVSDLDTIVIEDAAVPVRMMAEPWVGMVVEVRAVELGKSMRIVRKVSGSPVHEHTDSGLMGRIDEGHKVFGGSVPAVHCEVAGGLIAPGSIKRVLGNWQQFDVGIAHILHVRDEVLCEF